jgi:hypothetical protein
MFGKAPDAGGFVFDTTTSKLERRSAESKKTSVRYFQKYNLCTLLALSKITTLILNPGLNHSRSVYPSLSIPLPINLALDPSF